MATMDGSAGQRPRLGFAIVVLTLAAGVLTLPHAASADHGYQSYLLQNRTKEKADGVALRFDRPLSHVEKHTWGNDPKNCKLLSHKKTVECKGAPGIEDKGRVTISVATPPPDDPPKSLASDPPTP